KSSVRNRSEHILAEANESLAFRYEVPGFHAETLIGVQRSDIFDGGIFRESEHVAAQVTPWLREGEIAWLVELPAHHLFVTVLEVALRLNGTPLRPAHADFGEPQQPVEGPLTQWVQRVPAFESDSALLKGVFDQSVVDLAALRITGELQGERY